MTGGLAIAAVLVLLGGAMGVRQRRALRALADEPFVPDEDRKYRRNQTRRRMLMSGLLAAVGLMIAVYYFSGMDARMDAIPEREKAANGDPDQQVAAADKQFARLVALYWTAVMGLMFVAVCLALRDVWAARIYWAARYKELRADHDAKLRRDLAVYRQQKLNARAPGLKPPTDDTSPDEPPV